MQFESKDKKTREVAIAREIFIVIVSWDSIMSQRLQVKIVLQAKLRVTLYHRKIFKCNQTSRTPTGPEQPWKTMALTETSFGKSYILYFLELRVIKKNTGDLCGSVRVSVETI